jgi:hypothetical protein
MIAAATTLFAQIRPPEPIVVKIDWAMVILYGGGCVTLLAMVALAGVAIWLSRRKSRQSPTR